MQAGARSSRKPFPPTSQLSGLGWRLVVADTAVQGGIRGLFEGLVPAEVIDAYDRLLANNGCAKEQA